MPQAGENQAQPVYRQVSKNESVQQGVVTEDQNNRGLVATGGEYSVELPQGLLQSLQQSVASIFGEFQRAEAAGKDDLNRPLLAGSESKSLN